MAQQSVDKLDQHSKLSNLIQSILALAALIMIYVAGQEMMEAQLWGNLPLTFFFGCWLLGNVIFSFISRKSHNRFYFLLSTMSGFMLHLGFPDPSLTPILFFAFIPILYMIENEVMHGDKTSAWRVFRYSYNAFLLWNIMTTFWVANSTFLPSIIAFTLNSLFMTIPIVLYFYCRKKLNVKYALGMFVCFWLSFEFIHLRWEISWPWLTLGNAFATRTLWIQWYEFTGHLGGSLWVLLANFSIFQFIQRVRTKETLKVDYLLKPIAIIMIPFMISIFTYFGFRNQGIPVNVSVIQPNYEPHYEKFTISDNEQVKQFIKLSNQVLTDSTDYLVFPETAFGCYDLSVIETNSTMKKLSNMLKEYSNTTLVTGLCAYDVYNQKIDSLDALRKIVRHGQTRYVRMKNSAYELNSQGFIKGQEHVKGKLVPGAEIFPYSKFFFFLKSIVEKAGGSISGHARENPNALDGGKTIVAPAICYESIYGYWIRKFVNDGATLVFVITNDGWWDNTPGHRQHLAYSVLRAIEFRRSIARSANSGISCFIDQHGRVWNPTKYGEEAAISRTLLANDSITIYARFGDYIGRLALLFSAIFIAWVIRLKIWEKG